MGVETKTTDEEQRTRTAPVTVHRLQHTVTLVSVNPLTPTVAIWVQI